jgi:hypothetical protein
VDELFQSLLPPSLAVRFDSLARPAPDDTRTTWRTCFPSVRAIVIGRFAKSGGVPPENLAALVREFPALHHLPAIANSDFGHLSPILTLPIGGRCKLHVSKGEARSTLTEHQSKAKCRPTSPSTANSACNDLNAHLSNQRIMKNLTSALVLAVFGFNCCFAWAMLTLLLEAGDGHVECQDHRLQH